MKDSIYRGIKNGVPVSSTQQLRKHPKRKAILGYSTGVRCIETGVHVFIVASSKARLMKVVKCGRISIPSSFSPENFQHIAITPAVKKKGWI